MSSRKITNQSLDHTPAETACQSHPQTSGLDIILLKCVAKLKSWKRLPHWSARDWFEELQGLAQIAAWEALCDYKVGSTISIEGFIYIRIKDRVLTSYRGEWTYALRFVPEPLNAPECCLPLPELPEGEGRGGERRP